MLLKLSKCIAYNSNQKNQSLFLIRLQQVPKHQQQLATLTVLKNNRFALRKVVETSY